MILFFKALVRGHDRGGPGGRVVHVHPYVDRRPVRHHGAPPVMSFRSGASRPADFRGYMAARQPVGITLAEFGPGSETWALVGMYARQGGQIFIDSGAFKAFTQGEAVDWDRVMSRYAELAALAPHGMHFVAPDIIGDQGASLSLLSRYREGVRGLIASGHDVLVPIQRGARSPYDAWREAVAILGTADFSVAIPANKVAFGEADFASLFGGEHKPPRAHLLGVAGDKARLGAMVKAIHTRAPRVLVTSDANRLRAKIGEGRAIARELPAAREEAAADVWNAGPLDITELVGHVAHMPQWLRPDQVRHLAASMGVTDPGEVARWEAAHQSEGLAELLDEADADGRMTEFAVRELFADRVKQAVRSDARARAIAADEARAGAQHDLFGSAA